MIQWLLRLFGRKRTENSSNNKKPAPVSFALAEETSSRLTTSNRATGRRDPTQRTVALLDQPVVITNNNGAITVDPVERDLYDGEQVKWICQEPAWEIRFDQVGNTTPFAVGVFGPGLIPMPFAPETDTEIPTENLPGELSGAIRDDVIEGDYSYSAQIGGFGPLQARIKIIRGPRPR